MPIFATAGAKLYIGGVFTDPSSDVTVADFSGETWVAIKEIENLGTIGDAAEEVAFTSLDQARTKRLKGTRTAPPMELVCGIDYGDAGQQALIAAEKEVHDYAFKLEFNDAPEGGTPSERYFFAIVASASETLDAANNVMKLNATLWVNSNVARVDAADP